MKKTPEERFWEKINVRGDDDCWEWGAGTDKDGYGQFKVLGKQVKAHRFSWEMYNNQKIPNGLLVMHSCDNPSCVNPSHLDVGTIFDNIKDMDEKGRRRDQNGKNNHNWGKRLSYETRKKISESTQGERNHQFGKTGEESTSWGRKHSEETKRKMSELAVEREMKKRNAK